MAFRHFTAFEQKKDSFEINFRNGFIAFEQKKDSFEINFRSALCIHVYGREKQQICGVRAGNL